ncbi:MAG: hypothetical protein JWN31_1865, partial [Frankiales bacterium]|nr:hypothetical protein [Frankiales bacterium]
MGGLSRAALACAGLVLALASLPAAAAKPDDVRAATVALAHEAADLLALHAFPAEEQTNALTAALQGLPLTTPTAPAALRTKLTSDDAVGAAALARLRAGGAVVSREVGTALAPLTPSQLSLVDRSAL